jgi:uncharacterized membrane protein
LNINALFYSSHNTIQVIKNYLDFFGILYTNTKLEKVAEENPYFPSLLSISDTLNEYGVDNKSFRLDKSNFNISAITTAFIVEFKNSGESYFELVNRNMQTNTLEKYNSNKRKWESLDIDFFLKHWTGVALFAAGVEQNEEYNFKQNQRFEKLEKLKKIALWFLLPIIIIATSIYSLVITDMALFPLVPYLLLSFSGVFITLLLVWMEIDIDNYAIKNICSANKKINCNAVLESKASKVFGVSWSQIGLLYFIVNLILLIYAALFSPSTLLIVQVIYLISMPFCIFSIYYQWRVIKQWCTFCLLIQGVLVGQFIVSIYSFNINTNILSLNDVFLFLQIILITSYLFSLIIKFIKAANSLNSDKLKLLRIVHLPEVIKSVLSSSDFAKEASNIGLIIGDVNSPNKIIKVCNPYCSPCAKSHNLIEEILHVNKNVHLQIIFTAAPSSKDPLYFPVRHFMALAKLKGTEFVHRVLEQWYNSSHKSYEALALKHIISDDDLLQQDEEIKKMYDWCELMTITETPTFFINGYKLPDNLEISNLRYLFKNEFNS